MPDYNISAGLVILIGMAIVFSVLILIIAMIYLLGWLIRKAHGTKAAPASPQPTPAVELVPAAQAPAVPQTDGVDDEVVAVITAAVASMMGGGVRVRSIRRRTADSRSSWAQAGVVHNTTPF